ncbi:MAG: terpene cyclase/mutase family protein [Planctomycetia bacterium]|nr:terpene cyclase/mutase family protein [Planctomycetia bacterium]
MANARDKNRNSRSNPEAEPSLALTPDAEHVSPLQKVLSWLLSFSVHIVIMIILALVLFPSDKTELQIDAVFSDQLGDQLEILTTDEGNINPTEGPEYAIEIPEEARIDTMIVMEPEQELPFRDDAPGVLYDSSRTDIQDLLSGRTDPGTKNDLIAKYGGNKLTQDAVAAGLRWLVKQQDRKTGSWSLKGPFSDGSMNAIPENRVAATGMALLAFLGDGHTVSAGEHTNVVRRGWSWLLKQQQNSGLFYQENSSQNDHFYTHAICTIALCELIGMESRLGNGTDLEPLKYKARKAIAYLEENQTEQGGWRYVPGSDSDLSVTGWCLMALQTARMAGLSVQPETLTRITTFLDRVAWDDGSQYAYRKANDRLEETRTSMTATGLLCRLYLGWDRMNPALVKGADLLIQPDNLIHKPTPDEDTQESDVPGTKKTYSQNVYGWYSTTMMLKHLGPFSKQWRTWNRAMCENLPGMQEPANHTEAGSWNPEYDDYRTAGGRLYVTALSILCLEVYYRHLGLFQGTATQAEQPGDSSSSSVSQ